jgi:hypothetical protein
VTSRIRAAVAPSRVHRSLGAEAQRVVELFLHHVHDDHPRAHRSAEDRGREPHPAGPVHGEPFAGLERRAARQRVPGGRDPAAETRGDGGCQAQGQAREVVVEGNGHVFGEGAGIDEARQALVRAGVAVARMAGRAGPAGEDEGCHDDVADAVRRARPGLHHLAAIFVAADLTGLHPGMLARPAVPVRTADAAGQHLQDHAVNGARGVGDGFEREVRVVGAQDRRPHPSISTR